MAWNFDLYTDPESPDGRGGWHKGCPSVYVEYSDGSVPTSGADHVYVALGGATHGKTWLAGPTQVTLSASDAVEVYSSELPTFDTYADTSGTPLYVYCDKVSTFDSADLRSAPVSWTSNEPPVPSLKVLTVDGMDITSARKMPPVGLLSLEDVIGYTSGVTSGQVALGVYSVEVYADTTPVYRVTFDYERLWTSPFVAASPYIYKHGKWVYYQKLIVVRRDQGGVGAKFRFNIPFIDDHFPSHPSTIYAVVENTAGLETKSDTIYFEMVKGRPMVERVGVTDNETQNPTIIGLVNYQGSVDRVEYTEDTRVPLLHVRFGDTACSIDGVRPTDDSTEDADLTFGDSHLGGSGRAILLTGEQIDYPSSLINPNEGTVEFWMTPTGWVSGTHYLFDFGRKTDDSFTSDRISIYTSYISGSWKIVGHLTDSMGDTWTSTYDTHLGEGINGQHFHVKLTWLVNNPDYSYLTLRVNGNSENGALNKREPIAFSINPIWDMYSLTAAAEADASDIYTNIVIGNRFDHHASYAASAYITDLRITDCICHDPHWLDTVYSGWKTDNMSFNINTNMFRLRYSGLANDDVRVVKIRPVGLSFNQPAFYNTSACKPVLIKGPQTPTIGNSSPVYRMRLVDAQGYFDDLKFTLNPSSFSFNLDSDVIKQVSSVSGKRVLSVSPQAAKGCSMEWSNVLKDFADKIITRAESGNSFFLVDHNRKVYYGKLLLSTVDEIVATVPSRYRLSVQFIGQGGIDDYSMG